MAQTTTVPEPLYTGTRMELEEFIRRWEALPELKNAELIEGIVFVASPVSESHSDYDGLLGFWLNAYAAFTPGVKPGHNATCYMEGSAPQPDAYLRRLPTHGGQATLIEGFLHGAPELVIEVCESSHANDFGPKKALYQRAGVQEYITVVPFGKELIWRVLENGSYAEIKPDADGNFHSRIFPGLWLNPKHLWTLNGAAILKLLSRAAEL